jgi:hydrogenase/urease accessory protein HupE
MRLCAAFFVSTAVLTAPAWAHDVTRSDSKIEIAGREVHVALTLNVKELQPPSIPFDAQRVFDEVRQHYFVRSPAEPEDTRLEGASVIGGPLVQLRIVYTFPQDIKTLDVRSTLYEVMPPGHQHMMNVRLNGFVHEAILEAGRPEVMFDAARRSKLQVVWQFVRLGVEHIFTGYDHLAFLLGLLVATATIGSLVKIVTSFTIAHSITLALATFNLVSLPTRLTESLIAVSIAYVAAENLFEFRLMKRYYITFLFGLVHGFGFSSVLREMDLPRSSMAISLFSFNAGVEIGQITFVLLIFPLVQDLVSSGWTRLKPAVSIGVACLAVYWFVQRAF